MLIIRGRLYKELPEVKLKEKQRKVTEKKKENRIRLELYKKVTIAFY